MFRLMFLLLVLTSAARAESFDGNARFGSSGGRSFIAPDIPGNFQNSGQPEIPSDIGNWNAGTPDIADLQNIQPELAQLGLKEEPALAEFNYYGTDGMVQDDCASFRFHNVMSFTCAPVA